MATPCRAKHCPNLVISRLMKGYCDNHKQLRHGWQHTKSAAERGYGSQWKRLRRQVLKRDGFLCQMCKTDGRFSHATDVDHIKPKSKGGSDDLTNLQSLCRRCHQQKTRQGG